MATLLTKIRTTPDQRKYVKYDIGRTLGLTIVAVVTISLAVVLWVTDHNAPAQAVFSLGEAIVVGGFGIAYGEKRGAVAAGAHPEQASSE
jgi:uncharacterized membrane protein